jgi:hypothetical protein
MRSCDLNKTMLSYPNARVLAPKDLWYPLPSCSMVYPDYDNDDNGGRGKKNNPKCNGSTSLRRGRRRRRRETIDVKEGEECDKKSDIAGMGLMMLCKFEYNNDARFAAAATDDSKDDNRGEGGTVRLISTNAHFGVASAGKQYAWDAPEPGVLTGNLHHLASPQFS